MEHTLLLGCTNKGTLCCCQGPSRLDEYTVSLLYFIEHTIADSLFQCIEEPTLVPPANSESMISVELETSALKSSSILAT